MEGYHLVPEDKHDMDAVWRAAAVGWPGIVPVAGGLVEWLQDGNWPVAPEVAKVLAAGGEAVVPHVLAVLRGEDAVWKYWVLTLLVPLLDSGARGLLVDDCRRLAEEPGNGDAAEGVDVVARQVVEEP